MSQREKENTINKLKQFFRSVKSSGGKNNKSKILIVLIDFY